MQSKLAAVLSGFSLLSFAIVSSAQSTKSTTQPPNLEEIQKRSEFIRNLGPGVHYVSVEQYPASENARERIRARGLKLRADAVIDVAEREIVTPDESLVNVNDALLSPADLHEPGLFHVRAVNFTTTGLRDAQLVGGITSGTRIKSSKEAGPKWSGITRYFRGHPKFGNIVLDELDLAASKGTTLVPLEIVNTKVNGSPAILMSSLAPTGRSLTSLRWYTSSGKQYELKIKQISATDRQDLLKLAETISDGS